MEIKNLQELLEQFSNRNVVIVDCKTQALTSAGDNYGSQMLKVQIKISTRKNTEEETLNIVAKMPPPSEWLKEMFQTTITFKKEIAMYTVIFPTLREFQKEQGMSSKINFCPECYGARINLDTTDTVDEDAIILLENLQLSGFRVADRMKGFDLETTKLILADLAVFHAVPIALKLLKPDVFKNKVLSHFPPSQALYTISADLEKSIIDLIIKTVECNKQCVSFIPSISKALHFSAEHVKIPPPPREPFATINHNDFWVNNTMIKYESDTPVQNKMIDFQLIDYGSPDLYYDDLLKFYYKVFIDTLTDLKCDITPFSFERLQEEIDISAKTIQFFHVMDMLLPIFAEKGKIKELNEMTETDLLTEDQISNLYREKVPETILDFLKKQWI